MAKPSTDHSGKHAVPRNKAPKAATAASNHLKPVKPVKNPKAVKPEAGKANTVPTPAKPAKKPRPDLNAKILHLIGEEMAIEEAELTPNASFKEDLNLDELDIAELLMHAEQAFNLPTFDDDAWAGCETVSDFTKLIESRVQAKRSSKKS